MPLLNYTTSISAGKTAGEITQDLVKAGARGISSTYDDAGRMVGMTFVIISNGDTLHFSLPVRLEAVKATLARQKVEKRFQTFEHAEKVGWRILRDWVRAQLAIIETGMVSVQQVMLPYLQTENGQTFFERFESSRLLPAGTPKEEK